MKKEIKIFLTLFTMLLFTFSCEEKDSGDVTAPGKLSIDSITPTNGGGIISYTLPDDNDISERYWLKWQWLGFEGMWEEVEGEYRGEWKGIQEGVWQASGQGDGKKA